MIMIARQALWCHSRISTEPFCFQPVSITRAIPTIMEECIATVCYARSLECLSLSIYHIVLRTDLERGLTRNPWRNDWEETWATGMLLLRSSKIPRRSVKRIWNPLRNKTRWCIAFLIIPANAVRLRRSGRRIPRSAVTLSAIAITLIQIQIHPFLVILSYKN